MNEGFIQSLVPADEGPGVQGLARCVYAQKPSKYPPCITPKGLLANSTLHIGPSCMSKWLRSRKGGVVRVGINDRHLFDPVAYQSNIHMTSKQEATGSFNTRVNSSVTIS